MVKKEAQLVKYSASLIIDKTVKNSIKQFQKWKITLSGPDSGLTNTWNEICVQIQGEYSFHWDTYEVAVENHLIAEVRKLNDFEKFAIWLQTNQGLSFDEDEVPEIS